MKQHKNSRSPEQLVEDITVAWSQLDGLDQNVKDTEIAKKKASKAWGAAVRKNQAASRERYLTRKRRQEQRIKLGNMLNEARAVIEHGKWGQWLKVHFAGRGERVAQDYMKIASAADPVAADNRRTETKTAQKQKRRSTNPHDTPDVVRISSASTPASAPTPASTPAPTPASVSQSHAARRDDPVPRLDNSKPGGPLITLPEQLLSPDPVFTAKNAVEAMSEVQFTGFYNWVNERMLLVMAASPEKPAIPAPIVMDGSRPRSASAAARLEGFENLGKDEREICRKALADDVMPAANISWLDAFHTMTATDQDAVKAVVLRNGTAKNIGA